MNESLVCNLSMYHNIILEFKKEVFIIYIISLCNNTYLKAFIIDAPYPATSSGIFKTFKKLRKVIDSALPSIDVAIWLVPLLKITHLKIVGLKSKKLPFARKLHIVPSE